MLDPRYLVTYGIPFYCKVYLDTLRGGGPPPGSSLALGARSGRAWLELTRNFLELQAARFARFVVFISTLMPDLGLTLGRLL